MAQKNLKILVAGNVKGNYSKLFKRVADVNKKAGPFDLLLCVGDFFGDNVDSFKELHNRLIEVPSIATYVLGPIPKEKLISFYPEVDNWESGFELVDGITFLGKSGQLTTTQGLRIAYLSGDYDGYGDINDPNIKSFNDRDYESLLLAHQGTGSSVVDILLTTQWPTGIFNNTALPSDVDKATAEKIDEHSSMMISRLCKVLEPRYHFTSSDLNVFYERVPYRNHRVAAEQAKNVTRFISVAVVANEEKRKWLYAFNCVPAHYMTRQELVAPLTSGVTENPFVGIRDGGGAGDKKQDNSSGQYFYDLGEGGGRDSNFNRKRGHEKDQQRANPKRPALQVDLNNCWFCLASPNVDKSLIVSIGEHSYLALAKGGLTDDHMMILPIEHIRSTLEIQGDELRKEIAQFKTSLVEFFKTQDKVPVFFERNFKSAHLQLQVIALPINKTDNLKSAVAEVFDQFEHQELAEGSSLEDVCKPGYPYFYLECPGLCKFFVKIDVRKAFFPIQIGRELLAREDLLNCANRINWKACVLGEEESKELTKQIREQFKSFDFTV